MGDFLRQMAQELENNKALARRLAEPFQAVLLAALESSGNEPTARKAKSVSKQKKYPVPEGFDPYKIFYDEGGPGLYGRLQSLEVDELKGLLSQFTAIPRKDYVRKQNQEILVEMIVQAVKNVATRGQAFGDYKLD